MVFHVCLYGFLFSGRVALGDSGLYYVLCDKACLTADRPGLSSGDGRGAQRVRVRAVGAVGPGPWSDPAVKTVP